LFVEGKRINEMNMNKHKRTNKLLFVPKKSTNKAFYTNLQSCPPIFFALSKCNIKRLASNHLPIHLHQLLKKRLKKIITFYTNIRKLQMKESAYCSGSFLRSGKCNKA